MRFKINHLHGYSYYNNRRTFESGTQENQMYDLRNKIRKIHNKLNGDPSGNTLSEMLLAFESLVRNDDVIFLHIPDWADGQHIINSFQNNSSPNALQYLMHSTGEGIEEIQREVSELRNENFRYLEAFSKALTATEPGYTIHVFFDEATRQILMITNHKHGPTWYQLLAVKKLMYVSETLSFRNNCNEEFIEMYLELLDALLNEDSEAFHKVTTDLFEVPSIKQMKYNFITELKINSRAGQIEHILNEMARQKDAIKQYNEQIISGVNRLKNMEIEYTILVAAEEDKGDLEGLKKHLLNNPYITDVSKYDTHRIVLTYDAPLIYYDEDILNTLINSSNFTGKQRKILTAIKTKQYRLWSSCNILLDLNTVKMSTYSKEKTYFPHPHIEKYGCFGTHNAALQQWVSSKNYIGMIDQVTATAINLNFADGTVVTNMLRDLMSSFESTKTWEVVETGEMISTRELLEREIRR